MRARSLESVARLMLVHSAAQTAFADTLALPEKAKTAHS
jgi:hypothetical protein